MSSVNVEKVNEDCIAIAYCGKTRFITAVEAQELYELLGQALGKEDTTGVAYVTRLFEDDEIPW